MDHTKMMSEEQQFVTITEIELSAICFIIAWLTGSNLRDDFLPDAVKIAAKFAERAIDNVPGVVKSKTE